MKGEEDISVTSHYCFLASGEVRGLVAEGIFKEKGVDLRGEG